ncbi:hypothetical protein PRI8871_01774 [Pseudoprimorskyibacter insulae]|uniref:Uncharacterized protein n=2 Tax=Pseudoprimorskyibacter insulae TaxID=1695997 RepID=A0A2R8AVC1_9RHOB|nr:hypothetical protein PRI8871_01774 [Pseudoprimorskyibacter insulae]
MRSMDLDGAIETDQFLKPRFWLRAPLYKGDVEVISEMVEVSLSGSIFRDDPRFAFFASWYQGMLAGKPLDWELQRRIATEIPPEIWEAGIDAVAPEIARIEAEWESGREAQEPRSPEYEPNSVAHLFDYPLSVSGNLTVAANSISVGFEQFRAETGLNETPEFLQPLEAMSANMERIAAIVGEQVRSSMTEQALREEIGRLMAKVAHLEAELAKAKTDLDLKSKPWFGKAAILCSAAAGLGTAVWTLSGDEIGAKKRMETLAEYWEVGKGLFNTAPVEGPAPKPQLPPATDV